MPSPSPHPRITGAPPCRLKSRRPGRLAASPSSLGRQRLDQGGPRGWVRVPQVLPGGGAPPGDEAHPGSSGSEPSDGRSFFQREPSGTSGIRARCRPLSLPNGGRDHPALHVQAGALQAASAGLPCTPGSHGPRSARLCLLSFPVARRPRASASPSAPLCLALQRKGRRENVTEVSPEPRPARRLLRQGPH